MAQASVVWSRSCTTCERLSPNQRWSAARAGRGGTGGLSPVIRLMADHRAGRGARRRPSPTITGSSRGAAPPGGPVLAALLGGGWRGFAGWSSGRLAANHLQGPTWFAQLDHLLSLVRSAYPRPCTRGRIRSGLAVLRIVAAGAATAGGPEGPDGLEVGHLRVEHGVHLRRRV